MPVVYGVEKVVLYPVFSVDASHELSKNANHLDRSVLTDVFQFNLRYTMAKEIALSSRRYVHLSKM